MKTFNLITKSALVAVVAGFVCGASGPVAFAVIPAIYWFGVAMGVQIYNSRK